MGLKFSYADGKITLVKSDLRQYDNKTREIVVTGDLPEGYTYLMNVRVLGTEFDAIALLPCVTPADQTDGEYRAELKAGNLSYGNEEYEFQLEGSQGEKVFHSNIIKVYIPESFSGNAEWPEIPSVFSAMTQQAVESAESASESAQAAYESMEKAVEDAAAAQTAVQGMTFVSFTTDERGHLIVRNSERLGSTDFKLSSTGHLEVTI